MPNRKLEIYIERNGDVIPGDLGETGSLPGPAHLGNFWNSLLPQSNPEVPSLYIPNLPPIRGGISERWIKITRRYNDLVEQYNFFFEGSPSPKRIAFLYQKNTKLKARMESARTQLARLAYMHNEKIIMMRALDNAESP